MTSWQQRARTGVALFGLVVAAVVFAAIRERETPAPDAPVTRLDPAAVFEMQRAVREQISGAEEEYQIRFASFQSYPDGSARLAEVEIAVPDRHGRDFIIRAKEGFAGANQRDLRLTKDVTLSASDGFELATAEASFDRNTLVAHADGEVSFRKGRMRGSGIGMTYDQMHDVLRFSSRSSIVTTDERGNVTLDFSAGAAVLDRLQHVLSLENGVRVLRGEQVLESDRAVGRLSPDNDEVITYIELRGNARVTGGSSSIDAMSAASIDLDYTEDGQTLERVLLDGGGTIGLPTNEASGRRLLGDHLDLQLAPDGSLTRAAGEGHVRLDLPSGSSGTRAIEAAHLDATGESGQSLTSATFWNDACAPGQRDACVVYREQSSTQGAGTDAAAAGSAAGRVRGRIARAKRLVAGLNDDEVTTATFTGTVTFDEEGLAGSGAEARYAPANGTLHLTGTDAGGRPRVADGQITIDADAIDVTLADRRMTARGTVRTTLLPGQAATGARNKASRMPALLERSDAVSINAAALEYDGDAMGVYSGGAVLLQGSTSIRGRTLTLDQASGDLIVEGTAADPATSRIPMDAGDSLGIATGIRYDDRRRTITYSTPPPGPTHGRAATGSKRTAPALARLSGPEGNVTARTIDVVLADGARRLARLEARDEVTIEVGTRRATGAQLVFLADGDRYEMSAGRGAPVRLIDRVRPGSCNETIGQSLIFFKGTDRMVVDSTEVGRTQTKAGGSCGPAPVSR
jgi:lipopolysaccharide export system protein LptA